MKEKLPKSNKMSSQRRKAEKGGREGRKERRTRAKERGKRAESVDGREERCFLDLGRRGEERG